MMLRSSSTPVLGSLLSSFSESPGFQSEAAATTTPKHTPIRFSSHHLSAAASHNYLCNSSPLSPSVAEYSSSTTRSPHNGFRRAQSDGNLEALANFASEVDEFSLSKPPKMFARKPRSSMLDTIPSFSFHNLNHVYDEEEDDDSDYEEEENHQENDYLVATPGKITMKNAVLTEEAWTVNEGLGEGMYLAKGLGISTTTINIAYGGSSNGGSGDGNGGYKPVAFDRGGGDNSGLSTEEHYKRLLEEDPSNPLLLRNYAQFLYQGKGDLQRAEEYYSRAILADPGDGELLSQYAKLAWELHHDKDRATDYFERAVQAASHDSHVHAAYASFLWETEDEDQNDDTTYNDHVSSLIHREAMATTA